MKRLLCVLLIATIFFSLPAKVALVLSGGGARGLAHIAIIEAVEEAGIPIDLVVGTSMGALIGGLYSAGYTTVQLRSLALRPDLLGFFTQSPLVANRNRGKAFAPTWEHTFSLGFTETGIGDAPALLGDQRIMELFGLLFAKIPNTIDFDDLPIPFRAISTDVVSSEPVIHDHGSLGRAIRSSIAIPMIFSPFPSDDGRLLLDGGLVDNLPIQVARDLGATIVIASDVNAEMVDDRAQLESLSAIAMQTVTIATRAKARSQYEAADLLFEIPLKEITVLDFARAPQILERSEQAAEQKRDELRHLADQIRQSEGDALPVPPQSDRYDRLPDPIIRRVEVVDLSTVAEKRPLEPSAFAQFIGRPLDEKSSRELNMLVRELRITKGLSTLSYEMGAHGTLVILMRGYGRPNGQINMGFTSDMGFSTTLVKASTWYRADAYLDAFVKEVFATPLTLTIAAQLGSTSLMEIGINYPFSFAQWGAIDIDLTLGYSVGAQSIRASSVRGDRTPPLDRIVKPTLAIALDIGERTWLRLDGYYKLVFLHENTYSPAFIPHGGFVASLLYNTLENRFSSQGIRLEMLAGIGFSSHIDWQARLSFKHKVAITVDDSLRYDLSLSLLRMPPQLLDSYVEIGLLEGVGGYGPLAIKRDSALLGLAWQHRMWEVLGYPTYATFAIRGGLWDGYDPYRSAGAAPPSLFADPQWDVGFTLSIGFDAPIGEVVASVGASVRGEVTAMIGIH